MKSVSSRAPSVLLAAVFAAATACSGDQPPPPAPTAPAPATPAPGAPAPAAPATPPAVTPGAAAVDTGSDAPAPSAGTPAPTSNDPKDYPGLKIETLRTGEGGELTAGKKAKIHYIGTLVNGKEFDSSWARGTEPTEFALDLVVPGFRVGLLGMKVGERRRLTIPGQFGYQEAGSPDAGIGPNETLIFDVELVDVVD